MVAQFENTYKVLMRYAKYLTRNHHDAEELTSDTIERILSKGKALCPKYGSVVMHNIFIDKTRKKKRLVYCEDLSNVNIVDNTNKIDFDWDLFNKLSDRQKRVMILRYKFGLRFKEIESIMDEKSVALRALTFRSIKKLKAEYNGN